MPVNNLEKELVDLRNLILFYENKLENENDEAKKLKLHRKINVLEKRADELRKNMDYDGIC